MKHSAFLVSCCAFFLLLSGCGRVEIPEADAPGDTIIITDEEALDPSEEGAEEELALVEKPEETPFQICVEEKDKLSNALELNTEALEACEADRKRLGSKIQDMGQGSNENERYQKFVSFYLENGDIREYPFPKCGPVSLFAGDEWFTGFKSKLESEQIPFGNKIVETSDLSGGCVSPEGGMAFFLGAENETLSEFHLLKYALDTQTMEEAFLVGGPCDICPDQLGMREGKLLTIFRQQEGTKVEYEYYYDANIVKRR